MELWQFWFCTTVVKLNSNSLTTTPLGNALFPIKDWPTLHLHYSIWVWRRVSCTCTSLTYLTLDKGWPGNDFAVYIFMGKNMFLGMNMNNADLTYSTVKYKKFLFKLFLQTCAIYFYFVHIFSSLINIVIYSLIFRWHKHPISTDFLPQS